MPSNISRPSAFAAAADRATSATFQTFPRFSLSHLAWAAACMVAMSSAQAQSVAAAESVQEKEMPTVQVEGERIDARVYSREEMDATPEGNRDLTSLISANPAV